MQTNPDLPAVPTMHMDPPESKSASLAAARLRPAPGAQRVARFAEARAILRNAEMRQAGMDSAAVDRDNPDHSPVFYLDGEAHRKKRSAIARFFTPRAVETRYRPVMERAADRLLDRLRKSGTARLDAISFELAVAVAAEIVGLTNSAPAGLAKRVQATLSANGPYRWPWLGRLLAPVAFRIHGFNFYYRDVRPALQARRRARRDDVISHLLDEGYSQRAIMIECMTYGVAGMVTTREFIVMAAWHLLENAALRARFLGADEDGQFGVLEEILRLDPVASLLHRCSAAGGPVYAIDIRAANSDEAVVGACPHRLDPDRARHTKASGAFLSFGDGAHRCPGSQVALHETRIFLDRLLRLPGIRLARAPDLRWSDLVMGYELRAAIVTCDRAPAR